MRREFEKLSIRKMVLVVIMCFIACYVFELTTGIYIDDIATQIMNIGAVIYIFYEVKKNGDKLKFDFYIFKKPAIKLEIIKLFMIKSCLAFGFGLVSLALIFIIQPLNMSELVNERAIEGSLPFKFITGVVIAPVVEEFIMRGVIFTRLSTKISVAKAMIISSLLFATIHMTLNIGGAFVCGIIACMLFRKYNNILINISFHMLNNFMTFLPEFFSTKTNHNMNFTYSQINSIIVMGCMLIIPSIFCLIKYIKNNKEIFKKHESYELKDVS